MEQLLKTVSKLFSLGALILTLLVILGSIFTQQVRSNVIELVNALMNMGIIGFVVTLTLLYTFRSTPRDINKLIKARGFNKKLWDSL